MKSENVIAAELFAAKAANLANQAPYRPGETHGLTGVFLRKCAMVFRKLAAANEQLRTAKSPMVQLVDMLKEAPAKPRFKGAMRVKEAELQGFDILLYIYGDGSAYIGLTAEDKSEEAVIRRLMEMINAR